MPPNLSEDAPPSWTAFAAIFGGRGQGVKPLPSESKFQNAILVELAPPILIHRFSTVFTLLLGGAYMAHKEKYARSAVGHLAAHYERKKDKNGEYIRFNNQEIDPLKTHLNYNLAPEHEGGQVEFIRKRTSEVRCLNRSDVNVMCSWIVTMPKPQSLRFERLDGKSMDADRERLESLFFERTYRFLIERYGEQNVISAYVHKDEITPHIHFAFVPVVEDKKKGGYKVSAKEAIDLQDLKAFHTDLERYHYSYGDWKFEVINDATKEGNKEIAELKKETAIREVHEAQNEATEARKAADKVVDNLKFLESQKKALEDEINILQTKKEILSAEEIQALKGTKTLTGALKGVTYVEYETLKKTATEALAENKSLKIAVESANTSANAAETKVKQYAQAYSALKQVYDKVMGFLEQAFPDVLRKVMDHLKPPKVRHGMAEYKQIIREERAISSTPTPSSFKTPQKQQVR